MLNYLTQLLSLGDCGYLPYLQERQRSAKAASQAQADAYYQSLQSMYAQAGLQPLQMGSAPKPKTDGACTQCGAKSFRLTSDHGNWKHICSYCGSDK